MSVSDRSVRRVMSVLNHPKPISDSIRIEKADSTNVMSFLLILVLVGLLLHRRSTFLVGLFLLLRDVSSSSNSSGNRSRSIERLGGSDWSSTQSVPSTTNRESNEERD